MASSRCASTANPIIYLLRLYYQASDGGLHWLPMSQQSVSPIVVPSEDQPSLLVCLPTLFYHTMQIRSHIHYLGPTSQAYSTDPKQWNASWQVSMVATDVYRPAAIDQLVSLGQRVGVPVFEMGTDARPADIARAGLKQARKVCCAVATPARRKCPALVKYARIHAWISL